MTPTREVIDLHAVPHPVAAVRRAGFSLDHPYLEHCWTPKLGPSSVLLLRRCAWLWREAAPVSVATDELAAQVGLGRGTGRTSSIRRTIERVVQFGFAQAPAPGELHVYTEVPPVPGRYLEHLPAWCRREHERLLTEHIAELAPRAGYALSATDTPAPHLRMAERLDRLASRPAPPSLSR